MLVFPVSSMISSSLIPATNICIIALSGFRPVDLVRGLLLVLSAFRRNAAMSSIRVSAMRLLVQCGIDNSLAMILSAVSQTLLPPNLSISHSLASPCISNWQLITKLAERSIRFLQFCRELASAPPLGIEETNVRRRSPAGN